ncbi:class I SAM-dependent methyltransferase [Gammaproteobacteria bacterium]|nr:class I SAM-dependent methyltransferase [Gammaproteobacteria bacterium]
MKICPACLTENDLKLMPSYKFSPATMDKLKFFDEKNILCCPSCGFGMVEEDVDEKLLEIYYTSDYGGKANKQSETKSKIHDLRTTHSFHIRPLSQLSLIKQHIDLKSNTRVLEIGPGKGDFLFTLKQMGFEGEHIACEPQEQAHKFLKQLGSKIEASNFNSNTAKKYTESIDLVVMSHALEHFNPGKVSKLIENIGLMLKKGGLFFCEVPHADIRKYPEAGEKVVPHLSFFSKDSISHFINRNNLNIKFMDTCGVSQFDKEKPTDINELERSGALIFDKDPNNKEILRHRNYYLFLDKERRRLNKKHKILNLAYTCLGSKNLLSIINLIRRLKQPSLSSLLTNKHFIYGKDREYLRFIAQK